VIGRFDVSAWVCHWLRCGAECRVTFREAHRSRNNLPLWSKPWESVLESNRMPHTILTPNKAKGELYMYHNHFGDSKSTILVTPTKWLKVLDYSKNCIVWFKELNPRRRVYVEIPKPSRVELKCNQKRLGFWRNISDTREGFGISTFCAFKPGTDAPELPIKVQSSSFATNFANNFSNFLINNKNELKFPDRPSAL
jgi:hypothetical protein